MTDLTTFNSIPTSKQLLCLDAVLFAVYGWTPDKVKRLKLHSVDYWAKCAVKKMTWGDVYKFNRLNKPRKTLWQKLLLKIKS